MIFLKSDPTFLVVTQLFLIEMSFFLSDTSFISELPNLFKSDIRFFFKCVLNFLIVTEFFEHS